MGSPEQDIKHIDAPFHEAGAAESQNKNSAASPFRFRAFSQHIPEDRITAVLLVPFMPDRSIVAIQHARRGIDIPGGRREISDKSNYETARREFYEETGMKIGQMIPCLLMESEGYGDNKTEPSYMIVMTGVVQETGKFSPSQEVVARHFLSPESFLETYGGEYAKDMEFIIKAAIQTINDQHGAAPESFTWNQ